MAVILLIEKTSSPRYEKKSFRGTSTALKVLNKMKHPTFKNQAPPVEPKIGQNKNKWRKELNLIEYEMLLVGYTLEIEMNNQYRGDWKKDGHDEPAYDNMVPAAIKD